MTDQKPDAASRLPRSGGSGRTTRTGRRAGDSGTREAILAAARDQFAEGGYRGATIRSIAAAAGVDPALVHHYYGSKEGLFAAAMELPMVPSLVITAALAARQPAEPLGAHVVRTAVTLWDSAEMRGPFQGLLRTAVTSERAATMLREFLTEAILGPLSSVATGTDPETTPFRASLVASQMLGLAMTRYILEFGPLAAAGPDELAAAIGPVIDRYLTGDLGSAP